MTKREELDLFLMRADEFIDSKYILADVKIVNLLKTIASSETLLALFRNCLTNFDYEEAQKKYFIKNSFIADKGEFVLPETSRELLAFIFNILVDVDAGNIVLGDFLDKYFYVDGSSYSGYSLFINQMVKPFRNSVKMLMESVIDGKLQDPLDAFKVEEEKRLEQEKKIEEEKQKEKEGLQKTYGESLKKLREILLADKKNVKESKLKDDEKEDLILVIDMLANVIDSSDKDAINYAFIAYKYATSAHPILLFNRKNIVKKLIDGVVNEL